MPRQLRSEKSSRRLHSEEFKSEALALAKSGFYPVSTDGLKTAESFWSCVATLRRILEL